MADGTINIDLVLNAANSAQSVQEVRRAIRDLQSEAMKVGEGGAGFNLLISKAGELKEKFMDIRLQTKALSEDNFQNLTNAFSRMAQVGTGAFQVVRGYQALFGDESKKTTALLVELEGAMALTRGLQSLGKVADAWRTMTTVVADNLAIIGKSEAVYLAEAAAKEASAAATVASATAKEAEALATLNQITEEEALAASTAAATAAKVAETTAIEAATLAQKSFNLAALANPITAVIVAIMAAGAAYAYFSKQAEEARKAQLDFNLLESKGLSTDMNYQSNRIKQILGIGNSKNRDEKGYINNDSLASGINEQSTNLSNNNFNDKINETDNKFFKNKKDQDNYNALLNYALKYNGSKFRPENADPYDPNLTDENRRQATDYGNLRSNIGAFNLRFNGKYPDNSNLGQMFDPSSNDGLGLKTYLTEVGQSFKDAENEKTKNDLDYQKYISEKNTRTTNELASNSSEYSYLKDIKDLPYNTRKSGGIQAQAEKDKKLRDLYIAYNSGQIKDIEDYQGKIDIAKKEFDNKIFKLDQENSDREKQSKLESNESLMNLNNLYYKDSMSGINKFYNEKGNILKQKEEEELRITGLSEAGKQAIRDKYKLLNKQDQESQLTDLLNKIKQLSGNLTTISGTDLTRNTKAGIGVDTTDFSSYTMTGAYDAFHTTEEGRTLLRLQKKGIKTSEDYDMINKLTQLRDSSVYNTMETANNQVISNKNAPLSSEMSGNNAAYMTKTNGMEGKGLDIFGSQLKQWQRFYDERNKLTLRNIEINRQMELNGITLTGQAKINKEKEINAKYDKQNKENEQQTTDAKIAAINKWRDDRLKVEQDLNEGLNNLTSIYDLIRENGKTVSKEKEEQRAKEIFNIHKALTLSMAIPQAYFNVLASWKKFSMAITPIDKAMAIADMVAVSAANALNITKIATSKYESAGSGAAATSNTPPVNLYGNGDNLNNLSATNNNTNQQIRTYVLEADITNAQNNVSRYKTSAMLG